MTQNSQRKTFNNTPQKQLYLQKLNALGTFLVPFKIFHILYTQLIAQRIKAHIFYATKNKIKHIEQEKNIPYSCSHYVTIQ